MQKTEHKRKGCLTDSTNVKGPYCFSPSREGGQGGNGVPPLHWWTDTHSNWITGMVIRLLPSYKRAARILQSREEA